MGDGEVCGEVMRGFDGVESEEACAVTPAPPEATIGVLFVGAGEVFAALEFMEPNWMPFPAADFPATGPPFGI